MHDHILKLLAASITLPMVILSQLAGDSLEFTERQPFPCTGTRKGIYMSLTRGLIARQNTACNTDCL
jgi:hypothetical protein